MIDDSFRLMESESMLRDAFEQIATLEHALSDARARIVELEAAVRELRAAFAEYGTHRKTCYADDPGSHWTIEIERAACDCGYVAAVARIAALVEPSSETTP